MEVSLLFTVRHRLTPPILSRIFDLKKFEKGPGFFNKRSCCLLCNCSDRSALNSYFQNLPTTYDPPTNHLTTDHLPTTYSTDHIPTTYRPLTDHLPTTYTDHLPTTFLRCSLFTITTPSLQNSILNITTHTISLHTSAKFVWIVQLICGHKSQSEKVAAN